MFSCFKNPEDAANVAEKKLPAVPAADTLELVIVMHRHGARFPNNAIKGDLNWPTDDTFWKNYKAHLTPTGALQHVNLGKKMAARYVDGTPLFTDKSGKDITVKDMNTHVHTQSTNLHRTIFSAWSFLEGMFPDVPRYFSFSSDRQDLDLEAVEEKLDARGMTMGFPIHIESLVKKDHMFHQLNHVGDKAGKKFLKTNALGCPTVLAMAKDPAVMKLADKLYAMTEVEGLGPQNTAEERVVKMKAIMTQINIAKCHNMPLMPNKEAIILTDAELKMIQKAAEAVWSYWYRPASSDRVADGIGASAAGYLSSEIARQLKAKRTGKSKLKMLELSCHDANLLAFASYLGVDVDAPFFTGSWLIELHRPSDGTIQWQVRLFWVPNPQGMDQATFNTLVPKKVPLSGSYVDWSACPAGAMNYDDIVPYLEGDDGKGQAAAAASLAQLHEKLESMIEAGTPRKGLVRQLQTSGQLNITTERKAELKTAFAAYDTDGSNEVSVGELLTVMRDMGITHVDTHEVEEIVTIFDNDNSGTVTFDEFCIMMTMVDAGGDTEQVPNPLAPEPEQ